MSFEETAPPTTVYDAFAAVVKRWEELEKIIEEGGLENLSESRRLEIQRMNDDCKSTMALIERLVVAHAERRGIRLPGRG